MVVWSSLEASCPICSNRLQLREVGGAVVLGQDSDLLVRMSGKHVIQAEVHTCRHCRYSGFTPDFLHTFAPGVQQRFLREVTPVLSRDLPGPVRDGTPPGHTPLPHLQYFWAFKTAAALGLSTLAQGKRLLRAYWCLRLEPATGLSPRTLKELERLYLRGTIQKLRQSLRFEKDANLLYLVAELCRRNGNFLLAVSYFRRFIKSAKGAPYLRRAAPRLLDLAARKRASGVTMEEVLYNRSHERDDREAEEASGGGASN
jgi:hypothetical protein